jgi:pyruvate kinase
MMRAGLDVVRLNFSHATREQSLRWIQRVRRLNRQERRRMRILGDLEGPRIRVGRFKEHRPLDLQKGEILWLHQDADFVGSGNRAGFDYEGPIRDIRKGHKIFIDDGLIGLEVESVIGRRLKTRVIFPGVLKEFKGINIPGARLSFGVLSDKDKIDIAFCAREGLDFLAQSFVRSADDMLAVKKVLGRHKGRARLVAKIENADGIRNIHEILDVADGIMVARGDMGVSIPVYDVALVQKDLIRACNRRHKPVITATQMLERMAVERIPTRAEVSDVTNAVLDGSDYVMLSGETAVGKYPVEAVRMMNDIIKATERWQGCRGR